MVDTKHYICMAWPSNILPHSYTSKLRPEALITCKMLLWGLCLIFSITDHDWARRSPMYMQWFLGEYPHPFVMKWMGKKKNKKKKNIAIEEITCRIGLVASLACTVLWLTVVGEAKESNSIIAYFSRKDVKDFFAHVYYKYWLCSSLS